MTVPLPDVTLEIAPPEPKRARCVSIEDSLPGKMARRWNFLQRFLAARAQRDIISRLEPIVDRHFQHEWLAGVSVRLRFWPNDEDRELIIPWGKDQNFIRVRWMPWREEKNPAKWGAPITVSVYKHGKNGGRRETVRYMSLFVTDGIVSIAQLQGVPLIEMPKGIRDWAERFVKAAMEFAQAENLRAVRVARAHTLYSYHHPWLWPGLEKEVFAREWKRIRNNIETYHDETARTLAFKEEEDWFVWENPKYAAANS